MTDRTSTRKELAPNAGQKVVVLKSGTTLCAVTDTLTLTLADFGISTLLAVDGFVQTTDGSVVARETVTTAVSNGVLTVTPAAGNENKRRVAIVYGE